MRLTDDKPLTGAEVQAIALEAAARSWLEPGDVWDIASRASGGDAAALLQQRLDADRIATLTEELRDQTPLALDSSPLNLPKPIGSPARGAETMASPKGWRPGDRPAPASVAEMPAEPGPPAATGLHGDGQPDPGRPPGQLSGERYRTRSVLGKGGVGCVFTTDDREIGRRVALKTLRDDLAAQPRLSRKFLVEARVTARLEHPNIVPVYDIGVGRDGAPFYTMRIVNQQSLAAVLRKSALRREWSLARLLGAFVQVSRALGYAHSRGVLHGDIKPENILLGDFGEVYLADWGLTQVAPHSPLRSLPHSSGAPPSDSTAPNTELRPNTQLHAVSVEGPGHKPSRPGGTPGYVPPEVAQGDWSKIDHRSDLFALGVVLFEILTARRPFEGKDAADVILNTVTQRPPAPRELNPSCPLLLEDLCLELLAKKREDRPDSADRVAERVESYMEGAKENERRKLEAVRLCSQAATPVRELEAQNLSRRELSETAMAMLQGISEWEPLERKRPAWHVMDRAEIAEREGARALARAIDLYTKALGYDASSSVAHRALAELYWARACEAERERRHASQIYFETLTLEHDVDGHFAELIRAPATVVVESIPPGAHVTAFRYREVDRTLIAGEEQRLGVTPLRCNLEHGSYLIVLETPNARPVHYPVAVERGSRHHATIRLYRDDVIGDGFVFVPGGRAVVGGDPDALDALARRVAEVPDFAIQRFPVTMREYCAFLSELPHDEALKRAPHDRRGSEGLAVERGADGSWQPSPFIIEGPAREVFPIDDGHLWQVPAVLIDWFDARAYCRWRSLRDGCTYRLPTEVEWEKAARGSDGRCFPWGDRFDPTFCKMRDSRSFTHQPEPVGTFPIDTSPYGVRDMAGGMREWIGDIEGELTLEQAWIEEEPTGEIDRGASSLRTVRGGAWSTARDWCRAASRTSMFALARGTGLTMRLAKTLG